MDNEGVRKAFAQLYAKGDYDREQLAAEFNVAPDTISRWLHRPDVQALVGQFTQERANRITRRIDSILEGRLEHAEKMDTELLLKIRKELVPDRSETTIKVDSAGAMEDLVAQLATNPELAVALLGQGAAATLDEPEDPEDEPEPIDAVLVTELDEGD
jgi:transposase